MEQFIYFGEQQAGVELAERYFAAIDKTCLQLVQHPQSGMVYDSGIARLDGLRRFPEKADPGGTMIQLATEKEMGGGRN